MSDIDLGDDPDGDTEESTSVEEFDAMWEEGDPEPPEDSEWEDDAMHSGPDPEIDDYDHLAAAKQMLGVYYANDEEDDALKQTLRVMEVVAEALIALTERMTWVRDS